MDLLSPVTAPARVVAQAVNYRSHATDSGFDPDAVPPAFFRKASHSITGPAGDIIRPDGVGFLDYEVELGLVIGADMPVGTTVTEANLARYVAALVVANDVSARQVQLVKTQFYPDSQLHVYHGGHLELGVGAERPAPVVEAFLDADLTAEGNRP